MGLGGGDGCENRWMDCLRYALYAMLCSYALYHAMLLMLSPNAIPATHASPFPHTKPILTPFSPTALRILLLHHQQNRRPRQQAVIRLLRRRPSPSFLLILLIFFRSNRPGNRNPSLPPRRFARYHDARRRQRRPHLHQGRG